MQRKKEKKEKEESWFLSMLVNQCGVILCSLSQFTFSVILIVGRRGEARGLYFYFVLLLSSVRQQSEE